MAFSFGKKYKMERKFDIDTSEFEYYSLEDLYDMVGGDENATFEIRGIYINSKGKFDDAPVIAIEDRYVNLPTHLTGACSAMLQDDQCIKAINEGKCGFSVYKYHQKRFDKDCFGVRWVDL